MTDLERVVQEADQASLELHAAMLKFDMRLGLLQRAVDEVKLEQYELSVLGPAALERFMTEDPERKILWDGVRTVDLIGDIA